MTQGPRGLKTAQEGGSAGPFGRPSHLLPGQKPRRVVLAGHGPAFTAGPNRQDVNSAISHLRFSISEAILHCFFLFFLLF
jgi:hypothetical protein